MSTLCAQITVQQQPALVEAQTNTLGTSVWVVDIPKTCMYFSDYQVTNLLYRNCPLREVRREIVYPAGIVFQKSTPTS